LSVPPAAPGRRAPHASGQHGKYCVPVVCASGGSWAEGLSCLRPKRDHIRLHHLKSTGLAPDVPADSCPCRCRSLPHSTICQTPHHFLFIDLTVNSPGDLVSLLHPACSAISPTLPNGRSEHTTLQHVTSSNTQQSLPSLNSSGIMLLPFSVDHCGALGHFAHHFLANAPAQHTPFSPWPTKCECGPQGARTTGCFGSSYHTHTPSQWATQALSLNVSLGQHLSTALSSKQCFGRAKDRIRNLKKIIKK